MKRKGLARRVAEAVFVGISVLIGLAALISMSQALGEAVGTAYSAPFGAEAE